MIFTTILTVLVCYFSANLLISVEMLRYISKRPESFGYSRSGLTFRQALFIMSAGLVLGLPLLMGEALTMARFKQNWFKGM